MINFGNSGIEKKYKTNTEIFKKIKEVCRIGN
jgi:hypothetical protein